MKKILLTALAISLALPATAFANIAANVTWEVRATNGLDTNGGGFVPGVGGTDVSASATLAVSSGANNVVTSTAHNFVTGDVGKYIDVTAGTGWTPGWYQILSTASNAATLDHSPAAVSTTGGTFTLYTAIDYSQQNAAQASSNNLTTAGSTTITDTTDSPFTAAMVGNVCYITGGTGTITPSWYEITAYASATSVTVDRATGLTTGTGATIHCGGALKTLNGLAAATTSGVTAGNAYIKAEATYTTTSSIVMPTVLSMYGYTTTRNDGGRFTLQGQTTSGLNLLTFDQNSFLGNAVFDCNSLTTCTGLQALIGSGKFTTNNITIKNFTLYGFNSSGAGFMYLNNVEITGGGASSAAIAALNSNGTSLMNSWIHDNAGAAEAMSYNGGFVAFMINNIFSNNAGTCLDWNHALPGFGVIVNNTFYACGQGITGNIGPQDLIHNNIFANTTGWAINANGSGANIVPSPMLDGNAFYSNGSGNINGYGVTAIANPYVNSHDINLSVSPFVNAAGNNFSLNNTGGGGGSLRGSAQIANWVGLSSTTAYPDFGAVQHNVTGAAVGGSYTFAQ